MRNKLGLSLVATLGATMLLSSCNKSNSNHAVNEDKTECTVNLLYNRRDFLVTDQYGVPLNYSYNVEVGSDAIFYFSWPHEEIGFVLTEDYFTVSVRDSLYEKIPFEVHRETDDPRVTSKYKLTICNVCRDIYVDLKLKDFNLYSWEEIVNLSNRSLADKLFHVGDEKPLTINGQLHKIRIIDFNHDDLADGSGKAKVTFEFVTLYSDANGAVRKKISKNDEGNPWDGELDKFMNGNDFINRFPEDCLKNAFKTVKKVARASLVTKFKFYDKNVKFFVLAESEYNRVDELGYQYAYYKANPGCEPRVKYDSKNEMKYYWTRTAIGYSLPDSGRMSTVSTGIRFPIKQPPGAFDTTIAGKSNLAFAPCFCI